MTTYADEVIETWAEIYQACRLQQTGLSFEDFLAAPADHLNRLGMSDAEEIMKSGFLPLLPEQARVRMALAEEPATPPRTTPPQPATARTGKTLVPWQAGIVDPLCLT
ncbi:hypothetical protein A9404_00950 [Halothiobacillus diazotrophicus]|uniref:Uncharacterized protein n=1 Tax=Halothiobacillus diazotrophicus TaxID=1860122 RepID=A0A191ZE39_9GAMM|nr:hypothetical protein [Halothiobacillus diazotrophicus]ANJ66132.1 hypothetical protein A9404_00950 [Halothiobacillus diazotrophicus]